MTASAVELRQLSVETGTAASDVRRRHGEKQERPENGHKRTNGNADKRGDQQTTADDDAHQCHEAHKALTAREGPVAKDEGDEREAEVEHWFSGDN